MNWKTITIATLTLAAAYTLASAAPLATAAGPGRKADGGRPMTHTIHDFRVRTIEGAEQSLGDYRGQVLLIVNTASKCGFTPQYASLERIYRDHRDRGFAVLAFPANDFMNQEPGTDEEIKSFCTLRYDTSFPLFSKISVKGRDIAPLYSYLTRESPFPGAIGWNFTKFLVGRDGKVVARFDSRTDPADRKVTEAIEKALAQDVPATGPAEGGVR